MLNYSKSLEVTYTGKAAHYLWHLIINSVSLMILNTFVGMLGIGMEQEDGSKIPGTPFLAQPLLYSIVWIWCASNPLCEPRCEPQPAALRAPAPHSQCTVGRAECAHLLRVCRLWGGLGRARQNPDTQMSVFGFTTVKAVYFPWFLLAYHCVMGGGLNIFYLMGFAVGHIFYFLQTLHPGTRGAHPLRAGMLGPVRQRSARSSADSAVRACRVGYLELSVLPGELAPG